MASDSKRERLIVSVVQALKGLADVKEIRRQRPDLDQLKELPNTLLPLLAVTAGLPVPDRHWNERQPTRTADMFKSDLLVEAVLYDLLYEDSEYDSRVSSLADDMWVILHADQTWGKLAVQTTVDPDAEVAVWDPYLAFKMKLTITYIHGIGGI